MDDSIDHDDINEMLDDMNTKMYNKYDLNKTQLIDILHNLVCVSHALQESLLSRTEDLEERVDILENQMFCE